MERIKLPKLRGLMAVLVLVVIEIIFCGRSGHRVLSKYMALTFNR